MHKGSERFFLTITLTSTSTPTTLTLTGAAGTPRATRPATAAYVRAVVVDWSQEPFIRGAYSYPTLGQRTAL